MGNRNRTKLGKNDIENINEDNIAMSMIVPKLPSLLSNMRQHDHSIYESQCSSSCCSVGMDILKLRLILSL